MTVPPSGDQKIKLSYTSLANADNGLIEYVYPLKTDGKAVKTLEKFSLTVALKSSPGLRLSVDGQVQGVAAEVIFDVASPMSRVTRSCFEEAPSTGNTVRIPRPDGETDTASEVQALIKSISSRFNTTLIIVTHNQELANSMDNVYEMSPGGELQKAA